jgi:hypothetical protein
MDKVSGKTIRMLAMDAECKLRDFIGNGIWGSKTLSSEQGDKIIEAIGDYCVERVKEDHKGDAYFVVNGAAMKSVIKEAVDEHLKDFHTVGEGIHKDEPEPWWRNMRCPAHGEKHIHSMDHDQRGVYAIGWNCGCTFRIR